MTNYKIYLRLSFILLLWTCSFALSKPILASPLTWIKSDGIGSYSQDIRVSPSDTNTIYATLRTATGSGLFKSVDKGKNFAVTLPIAPSRDINSIAISNSSANALWIGTYELGVYKSIDGGITWNTTTGIVPKKTRYLTIDPTNDAILFAGTGENNNDGGLYKSTDFGLLWSQIGASTYGFKNNLNIYVDPHSTNVIYAGSDFGLFRSTNSGGDWINILSQNTYPPATLVDRSTPTTVYASVPNQGIYKTVDGGATWDLKNDGMGSSPLIFRLTQASDSTLYASRVDHAGGVWRSTDKAEHWENISDPAWGSRNTWGLDIKGERIFVSVEGLGIYYADTQTSPLPIPPVVFVPGFGASWSYKGLIENQPTGYTDWQLMPFFTDASYQPLITTLKNANADPLIFAYDFRQSITDSANSLNTFLADKTSGQKANIIGHSMGGLVARYCFEKVSGCSDKINKVVTAGSPHRGTLKAYPLWEAGDFGNMDLLTKTAVEIALHTGGFPYLTDKDIIQNKFPGVRDLLPLNSQPANPVLQSLSWSADGVLTSFSGQDFPTNSSFTTTPRSILETTLDLWADGKPGSYTTADGDGTVLVSSSQLSTENKFYSLRHNDYFKNSTSLTDLLTFFNLTPGTIVTSAETPTSTLSFIIHSPATISVKDSLGNPAGTNLDGKAVFIKDPPNQDYQVAVTGTGSGDYRLEVTYASDSATVSRSTAGSITPGQTQNLNYHFASSPSQNFTDANGDIFLNSFSQTARLVNNRQLKIVEALVRRAVTDARNNRNRSGALRNLEKAYLDIIKLLAKENNVPARQNLQLTAGYLADLANKTNELYGAVPSSITVDNDLRRAQLSLDKKMAKTKLSTREALNLQIATDQLSKAREYLSGGANYLSLLLARGVIFLVN